MFIRSFNNGATMPEMTPAEAERNRIVAMLLDRGNKSQAGEKRDAIYDAANAVDPRRSAPAWPENAGNDHLPDAGEKVEAACQNRWHWLMEDQRSSCPTCGGIWKHPPAIPDCPEGFSIAQWERVKNVVANAIAAALAPPKNPEDWLGMDVIYTDGNDIQYDKSGVGHAWVDAIDF